MMTQASAKRQKGRVFLGGLERASGGRNKKGVMVERNKERRGALRSSQRGVMSGL